MDSSDYADCLLTSRGDSLLSISRPLETFFHIPFIIIYRIIHLISAVRYITIKVKNDVSSVPSCAHVTTEQLQMEIYETSSEEVNRIFLPSSFSRRLTEKSFLLAFADRFISMQKVRLGFKTVFSASRTLDGQSMSADEPSASDVHARHAIESLNVIRP